MATRLRVKELLKERGWTTKILAEKTGMSESYLTHIKNSTRRWNEDALQKLADAFELDPTKLFAHTPLENIPTLQEIIPAHQETDDDMRDDVRLVPIVGEIPAQPSHFNNTMVQAETGYHGQFLPVCWANPTTPLFALHLKESSFYPRFDKGDYLIVAPTDKIASGSIVAVEYGEERIRTVMGINFTETIIVLEHLNQERGPIALVKGKDHCKVLGKVIYRYQKVGS